MKIPRQGQSEIIPLYHEKKNFHYFFLQIRTNRYPADIIPYNMILYLGSTRKIVIDHIIARKN
jgi:hypothetical protein